MSADADIVTEVVEDALSIPETALLYEGGDVFAEAVAAGGGPPERRRLRIGFVDGARVQILEGLTADDEVFVR
jgi:hypothetical protein